MERVFRRAENSFVAVHNFGNSEMRASAILCIGRSGRSPGPILREETGGNRDRRKQILSVLHHIIQETHAGLP